MNELLDIRLVSKIFNQKKSKKTLNFLINFFLI